MTTADLLRTAGAANYVGLSRSCLEKWRQSGDGPPFLRLGASIRYSRGDLARWLASSRSVDRLPNAPACESSGAFELLIVFNRGDGKREIVGSAAVQARSGVDVYDQVASGEIPYSDPRVKAAWEKYGQIVLTEGYTVGGATAALATTFSEGSLPLFQDPPGAFMHYMGNFNAGFITDTSLGFPEGLVAGTDFDFFAFPTITEEHAGTVTGDGNMAVIFNSDDTTCSFLDHVTTAAAQQIWVGAGGFLSLDKDVPLDRYPNDLDRAIAEVLASPDSEFRFDLDDAMPSAAQTAVFTGIQEYLSGTSLDEVLAGVEAAFSE